MSRKIARITQDKKLLLANEIVENNTKISLNDSGKLDVNEIIEYPIKLEGGRNLLIRTNELKDHWVPLNGSVSSCPTNYVNAVMDNYIAVIPRETLTFTKTESIAPDGGFWRWRWLNINGDYISRKADNRGEFQWVVPDDTYFIQVSYPTDAYPKIEFGSIATSWTPAPEDLGLNYPDDMQSFGLNINNNSIETSEFIEGYPFVKPVIDESLVLWLDGTTENNYEKTSVWKDLSGKENHGELVNFGYTKDSGWGDGGLRFDGVDDYVNCGNDSSLNPVDGITIETIAECTVAEFFPLTKGQNGAWASNSYGLRNAIFYISDDTDTLTQLRTTIPANKLIHTIVRTSNELGKLECWIDGELKYSINKDSSNIKLSNYLVQIGTTYGSVRRAGVVKLVRIYNRALTDEEILQNYQAGQCSPLPAIQDGTIVEFPHEIKTEGDKLRFIVPQMTVTKEVPLFITLNNIVTDESEGSSSYVNIILIKNADEIVTPFTSKKDGITYKKKYIYDNNAENYVAIEELVPEDTPHSDWDIKYYPKDESKNIYHSGITLIPNDNIKLFIHKNTFFEVSFDINIRKFTPDGVIVHSMRIVLPSICYLTTAMIGYFDKDDDGIELNSMRKLREYYKDKHADILVEYYQVSPSIIEGIEQSGNKDYYYNMIKEVVDNIVIWVANKEWEKAEIAYLNLYNELKEKFGGDIIG